MFGGVVIAKSCIMRRRVEISDAMWVVDKSKCKKCGLCASSCPVKAIKLIEFPVHDENKCVHCMMCMNMCPMGAISWE
jgi:ferredoxin